MTKAVTSSACVCAAVARSRSWRAIDACRSESPAPASRAAATSAAAVTSRRRRRRKRPAWYRRAALTRQHRQPREVPLDVVGHCAGRSIAPCRLLPQRHHDDRVDVAAELARQLLDRRVARGGDGRGRDVVLRAVGAGDRLDLSGPCARPFRILRADHLHDLLRRSRARAVRPMTRDELVQNHAQRVDVARRRQRVAAHLLRARVVERHHPLLEPRQRRVGGRERRVEQLGDAEVEQLHAAGRVDDDVRGLEVAVDDEVLVRVLDRRADVEEQPQPRLDAQPVGVAVRGDRLAVHVLHHEVRQLAVGDAAVEELRDVRMAQRREDLPLGEKSPLDLPVVEAAADDFDRHAAAELAVVTLGEVDDAHAAASELAQHLVRSDVADSGLDDRRRRATPPRAAHADDRARPSGGRAPISSSRTDVSRSWSPAQAAASQAARCCVV